MQYTSLIFANFVAAPKLHIPALTCQGRHESLAALQMRDWISLDAPRGQARLHRLAVARWLGVSPDLLRADVSICHSLKHVFRYVFTTHMKL